MNSIFDVRHLLKTYGTYIYLGDRIADLELMEDEVRELYQSNMIDIKQFQRAILLLRQEMAKESEK
ncbi:YqgQ family protein [Cytobacillus suaedae]|nr:YqgQ family protein [Cytobacillus suaedae]